MRRTNDARAAADANIKARASRLFAGDPCARLDALRVVVGLGLLSGVALSFNLWFPAARSIPRAPLVAALPRPFVPAAEYLLGGLLVAALIPLAFAKRPARYSMPVIVLLVLLVLLDQTRLQPWVYQYLLLLVVLALRGGRGGRSAGASLSAVQLIIAALYFWSGAQKLNYSFGREVLPQLLAPLQPYLPLTQTRLSWLAIGIALVEIFTGCGLLLRRTRELCVWLALSTHGLVLALLVGRGHNSVVWAWNAALMLSVVISFRRSDTSVWQSFARRAAGDSYVRAAQAVALCCAVLPLASFWGWWDMYLSGALYSGNTPVAVVRVGEGVYEGLPETAKRQAFTTSGGERMLPLFEWSMAELNVPPYPEPRVYRRIAREVCGFAGGGGGAELIVKGSPARRDGSYQVTRMNCSELDR